MDSTDQKILAELRRDGRASLSDLAARLSLSRATLRQRIERMSSRGDIAGFTVLTRHEVTEAPVRALMMIGIEGRGGARILARLSGLPHIQAVHSTNGTWDIIAEIGAATLQELDDVIHRVREIEGIIRSETNLLLTTRRGPSRLT
ncbi:Lrp/AsnC family transcriptional regulator [Falsigemmobacter intermedius]|uniref:Lrp/AsnC family transcriptional regulator n=1 Tax=Falsigemmobacter intermedius TaxID=1553448 RepID=A0A451GGN4_9RHOB|nr:Lrp/AsnC family transcriptional regulator [Falsigemmobacter intermedius]RWY36372.1 Lrp/AsnC family transcriptional regulator [Falsigemmobacter intermedius]